jgi:predicted RNase H-like HicB family nuclease
LNYEPEDSRRFRMHRYEVIIYWSDEDNAFIAEVPELPGCMADGTTYEEALKNVQVIIDEWIETAKSLGREIPAPKGKLAFA